MGCAAGHVMVASYEDESAKCAGLEKELGVAQARMQKLKATDSTDRNIRNFFFGSGWVHHPATWNHKRGFAFDRFLCGRLHVGKTLKNRYNNMVMISQRQGCGTKYALIPIEAESKEPNA